MIAHGATVLSVRQVAGDKIRKDLDEGRESKSNRPASIYTAFVIVHGRRQQPELVQTGKIMP